MKIPRGFLEDANGDKSNSRLIADVIVISALLMVAAFIFIGVFKPLVNLLAIATAISVLFGSIAGSALLFLFGQKWTEGKQKPSLMENDLDAPTS